VITRAAENPLYKTAMYSNRTPDIIDSIDVEHFQNKLYVYFRHMH